jgi:hypothetical protein
MADSDLTVALDLRALQEIHRCWQQHLRPPVHDLSADEALARRLQAEEEEQQSSKKSLRDIMAEEEALEASKSLLVESQALASGQQGALSTQLKMQQLTAMFPLLTHEILEETFKAHGFCLHDTVCALQSVHGPSQPVCTRVTAPGAASAAAVTSDVSPALLCSLPLMIVCCSC